MASTGYFYDWFFRQFPAYHQQEDTYKNVMGEGIWQRYLRVYGEELDLEFVPYLDNFLNIIDYLKCDDKFLPLIGSILGYPPSIDGLPQTYRKVLAFIVAIYKVKGTCRAYEIMFNLLGMEISIIEDEPKRRISYDPFPIATYDEGQTYDSECEYCSNYSIAYRSMNEDETIDAQILANIQNIICFLQPINAKFTGLVEWGGIWDDTFDDTFGEPIAGESDIFNDDFDNTFN